MSFMRNKGKKVPSVTGKLKRKEKEQLKPTKSKVPKILAGDINSDSEDERDDSQHSDSDIETETPNEKRTRLAKEMLEKIKEKVSDENGDVSSYLRNELMEKSGRVYHEIADEFVSPCSDEVVYGRWGRLKAVTCVVVTNDNSLVFSASKDGAIVKWSLPDCVKVGVIKKGENPKNMIGKTPAPRKSHFGTVNALAVSSDNKYLASGGEDKVVNVWHVESLGHVHQFSGHRDAVMSLAFQQGSHVLYSGSKDRSIKLWNLNEMAYIETLWGHEDQVTSLSALSQERVVSGGGRDGSVRLWKIPEESHLVFQAAMGCIDCVSYVDNKHFIAASNENKISLWATDKKKSLFTINNAHHNDNNNDNDNNNNKKDCIDGDNNIRVTSLGHENNAATTLGNTINETNNNPHSNTNNHTSLNGFTETMNNIKKNMNTQNHSDKNTDQQNNTNPETNAVIHTEKDKQNNTDADTEKDKQNNTDADTEKDNQNNTDKNTNAVKDKQINTDTQTDKQANKQDPFTSASELNDQWICSLEALKHSNLFASGSRDGLVRFWKIENAFRSLKPLFSLPLRGFINDLKFSEDGSFVVAAVAQEHRMGRWFKTDKTVKNSICLIPLKRKKKTEDK